MPDEQETTAHTPEPSTAGSQENGVATTREPTAGELAIERILALWVAKDYFRHVLYQSNPSHNDEHIDHGSLLQLPEPEADELGRPTWSCTAQDVARAYRRISVQVHPDKHPGNEKARDAFEALKATHKILTDRGTLVWRLSFVCIFVRHSSCMLCCRRKP